MGIDAVFSGLLGKEMEQRISDRKTRRLLDAMPCEDMQIGRKDRMVHIHDPNSPLFLLNREPRWPVRDIFVVALQNTVGSVLVFLYPRGNDCVCRGLVVI